MKKVLMFVTVLGLVGCSNTNESIKAKSSTGDSEVASKTVTSKKKIKDKYAGEIGPGTYECGSAYTIVINDNGYLTLQNLRGHKIKTKYTKKSGGLSFLIGTGAIWSMYNIEDEYKLCFARPCSSIFTRTCPKTK